MCPFRQHAILKQNFNYSIFSPLRLTFLLGHSLIAKPFKQFFIFVYKQILINATHIWLRCFIHFKYFLILVKNRQSCLIWGLVRVVNQFETNSIKFLWNYWFGSMNFVLQFLHHLLHNILTWQFGLFPKKEPCLTNFESTFKHLHFRVVNHHHVLLLKLLFILLVGIMIDHCIINWYKAIQKIQNRCFSFKFRNPDFNSDTDGSTTRLQMIRGSTATPHYVTCVTLRSSITCPNHQRRRFPFLRVALNIFSGFLFLPLSVPTCLHVFVILNYRITGISLTVGWVYASVLRLYRAIPG